jgi:hypothetical protein
MEGRLALNIRPCSLPVRRLDVDNLIVELCLILDAKKYQSSYENEVDEFALLWGTNFFEAERRVETKSLPSSLKQSRYYVLRVHSNLRPLQCPSVLQLSDGSVNCATATCAGTPFCLKSL